MEQSVKVSPAMRFAAQARQCQLERLQCEGAASFSDDVERRALSAARYWESFSECYPVELVDAGSALIGFFVWVTDCKVAAADVFAGLQYRALVQRCADLVEVQR